jgi:hypothetical protein
MPQLWAGIDAGKGHHHCVVIDAHGNRLLSRRIVNDEAEVLDLVAEVSALAETRHVCWATDLNGGAAGLLLSILTDHQQLVHYVPGRAVHHAARTYRGDGKTDANDAGIIADQARMRRDLQPHRADDQLSTELRLLTARRTDLVVDWTRAISRLRAVLLDYFPAVEAEFEFAKMKAAVVLVSRYQTSDSLRRVGQRRLTACSRANTATAPRASRNERSRRRIDSRPQSLGSRSVLPSSRASRTTSFVFTRWLTTSISRSHCDSKATSCADLPEHSGVWAAPRG